MTNAEQPGADDRRSTIVLDGVEDYVLRHSNPASDEVSAWLTEQTWERFGDAATMNIGLDQGLFVKMLVELTGARTVAEVGTFTGMSALWLARGLPPAGRLTCFERWEGPITLAREAWERAGVADKVDVEFGPALERIAAMPDEWRVDLAFVDADKPAYRAYVEALLSRLNDGGLIAVDNTLWGGRVADPAVTDADTVAIRDFNTWLSEHPALDVVILTVGDGLTLVRPRS